MINLLPPEIKQSHVFARRNLILIKWGVATCLGVAGIGLVVLAGLFYINFQTDAYTKEVEQGKAALTEQKMDETQNRVKEIDTSVKLALQVLSRGVLFSKLLKGLGGVMPPGSSLQSLSIGNVDGGIDLQAIAVDYQTATQVQVNLSAPENEIFEKADILSVSCASGEDVEVSEYPCQVSIRALFAKDSPFLFSTKTAGGSQ